MMTTSSHTHPNSHIKASSTCIPFCLKTEIFPLVWPTVHSYPVKTVTENASFQKRFPEWRLLKTPTSRLRVNGRKPRFSSKMMSYIIYVQHDACFVRDSILIPLFQLLRVEGRKQFKYVTCGCVFFEKGGKNLRFQKYLDTYGLTLNLLMT